MSLNNALAIEFYFELPGNQIARFSSNSTLDITESQIFSWGTHLPGLNQIKTLPHDPDINIDHIESGQVDLKQKGSHVVFYDQWKNRLSPDFVHLFYGAARLSWLKNGILPIHAACVGKNDDGYILLVGHPGVGKSSITLQLAHENELQVFSGDKTLISIEEDGAMSGIGGTTLMTIRQEDVHRWPALGGDGVQNGDRYTFRLKSERYSSLPRVKIKAIALVQLNDGVEKNLRISSLSALHTLYPYFMDVERADILLAGGKAVFDGTLDQNIKRKLVLSLAKSLENIPVFNIVGSLRYVTEVITHQFRGKSNNSIRGK